MYATHRKKTIPTRILIYEIWATFEMYENFENAHLMTNFLEIPCAFLEVIALFLQYRAIRVGRNKHKNTASRLPLRGSNSSTVGIACCRINLNFNFRFLHSLFASHNSCIDAVIRTIGQMCGESSVVVNTYVNITWTFFFSPLVGSTISIARRLLPFHP
jgi:hypothetical protein